ncbi:MAG: Lrp/AsnC family transcriptional regulator [Nitrosopumilaceae archaeon]
MTTAHVLLNCDMGSEESVIQELKSIIGVKEVHGIFGAYDVIAKIETKTVDELRQTVIWKIRKINGVRSTLTLLGIEGQS